MNNSKKETYKSFVTLMLKIARETKKEYKNWLIINKNQNLFFVSKYIFYFLDKNNNMFNIFYSIDKNIWLINDGEIFNPTLITGIIKFLENFDLTQLDKDIYQFNAQNF